MLFFLSICCFNRFSRFRFWTLLSFIHVRSPHRDRHPAPARRRGRSRGIGRAGVIIFELSYCCLITVVSRYLGIAPERLARIPDGGDSLFLHSFLHICREKCSYNVRAFVCLSFFSRTVHQIGSRPVWSRRGLPGRDLCMRMIDRICNRVHC